MKAGVRVAHVISSPAGIGGAEQVLLQLIAGGMDRGWGQRVLHPFVERGESSLAEACPPGVYRGYPCSRWRELPGARAWLACELRDFRPQIIHVHLFHALVLFASLRRPPAARSILTHHHGALYASEDQRLRTRLDRLCGRRFDAVVAVSGATHRLLSDSYGYPQAKLRTIRNGWSGSPRPKLSPGGTRIVSVANFRPEKGLDVLLAAFAEVVSGLPAAELTLVGDGPLRAELEAQARALGIAGRVRFVGRTGDVWPLLAAADVFALPSRYETLGLAALEAMAAGLPVVASDVGGLSDLIVPGVTGELVPPGDPSVLAQALEGLLRSPAKLVSMGAAGRKRAAGQRVERTVAAYAALYGELLLDDVRLRAGAV